MPKAFTKAKTLEIAAYSHKHGWGAAVKKFGCAGSTVSKAQKRAAEMATTKTGAKKTKGRKSGATTRYTDAQRTAIGEYKKTHTYSETIEKFGCGAQTVADALRLVEGTSKKAKKAKKSQPSRPGQGDVDLPGLKQMMLESADKLEAKAAALRNAASELGL